jgi:hypothetical protein
MRQKEVPMHDFPLNNAGDGHRFVDLNSGETVTLTISQLNAVADAAHFYWKTTIEKEDTCNAAS